MLFVGRFDRHKGGDLVIDAFHEIATKDPNAELLFAGPDRGYHDGAGKMFNMIQYVENRISEGDVRRRWRWLGPKSQSAIAELRRCAAVTVVASRYENFPMTVVEAMAFGTPLVAPNAGGISEIIRDGETALAFRAGDSSDLAAKIRLLFDHPELAAKLAASARKDHEARLSPKVIAPQMAAFYARVLARRHARTAPAREVSAPIGPLAHAGQVVGAAFARIRGRGFGTHA
jgi:glycosyltransferase involved in cell wall biosynthesis